MRCWQIILYLWWQVEMHWLCFCGPILIFSICTVYLWPADTTFYFKELQWTENKMSNCPSVHLPICPSIFVVKGLKRKRFTPRNILELSFYLLTGVPGEKPCMYRENTSHRKSSVTLILLYFSFWGSECGEELSLIKGGLNCWVTYRRLSRCCSTQCYISMSMAAIQLDFYL